MLLDWTSQRGREVARTLATNPNATIPELAKMLGVKRGSASAYFYDWRKYRTRPGVAGGYAKAAKTTTPTLTAKYPNGGVSGALMELHAERQRIDAAITALQAVTLTRSIKE